MSLLQMLACMLLMAVPTAAWADLRVNATRVVYQSGSDTATSIRIQNVGKLPSLIQSWIDDGDEDAPLERLRPALFVTPPAFRLDAGSNRDIQIRAADTSNLPKDRESLLWLNIVDVPARATSTAPRSLEFAMRWRLKVFHRPAGLPGSADAAPPALTWRLQTDLQGRTVLLATNATPYFVSLAQLTLDGQPIALDASTAQVPPMSRWTQVLANPPASRPSDVPLNVWWVDARGLEQQIQTHASRTD